MDSIKVKTYVGGDGLFSLRLPIINQDIEAMVIYQSISKNTHKESQRKCQEILQSYSEKLLTDSTELLREDRQSE
jgi:hypothetical protein